MQGWEKIWRLKNSKDSTEINPYHASAKTGAFFYGSNSFNHSAFSVYALTNESST